MDSNDPKWKLMGLMIRFVELRQAAESCVMSHRYVLDLARTLDDDFVALCKDMPPSWQYETILVKECSDLIYGNCYHIYRDVYVTQTWNALRLARILTNEMILEQLQELLDSSNSVSAVNGSTAKRGPEEESIITITSEICASVPQYTGSDAKALNSGGGASERRYNISCYTLLFPLFVAAQSSITPPSTRQWILTQLRFMSNELDVRNAQLVLNILELYAMLGGYAFVA